MTNHVQTWLEVLGYTATGNALLTDVHQVGSRPYAPELHELLQPEGEFELDAVFAVEDTPTVCFIDAERAKTDVAIDRLRQKLWNQNLASALLVVSETELCAYSIPTWEALTHQDPLSFGEARFDGHWSATEVQSSDLQRRLIEWFDPSRRVDRDLLRQLSRAVTALAGGNEPLVSDQLTAQMLLAQVLFICFLEHRGIVGDTYRERHHLKYLHELISSSNGEGVDSLIERLKLDFNGDFLQPGEIVWSKLPAAVLKIVSSFLARVDLKTAQLDFWNYDFSQIPVELLSGIYETFLQDTQKLDGAYYTPRVLAELAVGEAFDKADDITTLTVYDGACGSGILLTTAYRKMVYERERKLRRKLDIHERIIMLEAQIYGGDISEIACRVTAFSLYLCILERLNPVDIAELQDDHNCQLPELVKTNIYGGLKKGDFFSKENPLASSGRFDVALSNPPWRELKSNEQSSAIDWARLRQVRLPHRQVAAAFAAKATEAVRRGGRIVMILPSSLITAPTNADFLRQYTVRVTIKRLINLSDFRRILFAQAEHACTIVCAENNPGLSEGKVKGSFQYWTPKADISFAFNRLALHDYDMLDVARATLVEGNAILRRRFWGGLRDENLVLRLGQMPQLGDFMQDRGTWVVAKGYHKRDGRKNVDPGPLTDYEYLPTRALNSDAPVVDTRNLTRFPKGDGVAGYGEMRLYDGPRILWSDGTNTDMEIRAAYTDASFCFSSGVGGISVPEPDRNLARFLTCYLRSSLAKYWLILTGYSAAAERARVTIAEIKSLPFLDISKHPRPEIAASAFADADRLLTSFEKSYGDLFLNQSPISVQQIADRVIYDYFGLSASERSIVSDMVHLVAQSLQPTSYQRLRTPLQADVSAKEKDVYLQEVEIALLAWSHIRGGKGSLKVSLIPGGHDHTSLDVVYIALAPTALQANRSSPHAVVRQEILRALGLKIGNGRAVDFFSMPNSIFVWGDNIYIVKPTRARFWTRSAAFRDADAIFDLLSVAQPSQEHVNN